MDMVGTALMARFADNPGIVPAGCQDKSDILAGRYQMNFIDGLPRCDMILSPC